MHMVGKNDVADFCDHKAEKFSNIASNKYRVKVALSRWVNRCFFAMADDPDSKAYISNLDGCKYQLQINQAPETPLDTGLYPE